MQLPAGLPGAKPRLLLALVIAAGHVFITLTIVIPCVDRGEAASESECDKRQKENLTHEFSPF